MISRRRFVSLCGGALPLLSLRTSAAADASINLSRILVGFTAGGSIDAVARLIAEPIKMQAPNLIVENRPGAGGRIALTTLRTSVPDASVIALTPGDQLTLFPHIYSELGYRPLEDFVPITTACTTQFLLTIGPMVPVSVKTLDDFWEWCRENPKLATYGSPGAGTRPHFVGVALKEAAKVDFAHTAYKGSSAAIQDMLGGHIAANIGTIGNTLGLVQGGRLRALATTAPVRSLALPEVPTVREAGYAMAEGLEWFGFFAPAKTPSAAIETLRSAIHSALARADVKEGMAKLSLDISTCTPNELVSMIIADTRRSAEIVKLSGFKIAE